MFKYILRDGVCGLDPLGSGHRGVSDCFGHGNERLRFIKNGEFLEKVLER
jgi:hypothetical protein